MRRQLAPAQHLDRRRQVTARRARTIVYLNFTPAWFDGPADGWLSGRRHRFARRRVNRKTSNRFEGSNPSPSSNWNTKPLCGAESRTPCDDGLRLEFLLRFPFGSLGCRKAVDCLIKAKDRHGASVFWTQQCPSGYVNVPSVFLERPISCRTGDEYALCRSRRRTRICRPHHEPSWRLSSWCRTGGICA